MAICEHCGIEASDVRADRYGNILCDKCAEIEQEAE